MNTLFVLVRKDLALFFADRKGAAMVIAVPLILGLLMGTIFDPSDGPSELELGVVDEDGSDASKRLVAALDAEASLLVVPLGAAEGRDRVARGKIGVVVQIPKGSGERITAASLFAGGKRHTLSLWYDPSRKVEADIVGGLLTKTLMETVFSDITSPDRQRAMFEELRGSLGAAEAERPELTRFLDQGLAFATENEAREAGRAPGGSGPVTSEAGGLDGSGGTTPSSTTRRAAGEAGSPPVGGGLRPPLDIVPEPIVAAGPSAGFDGYAHTFAGMLMQFLLFAASGRAKSLFRERASGTLDRIRSTRAGPALVLVGAAVAQAIVALIATAVVFGAGILLFGIELRSGPVAFGLVAVGQALCLGSFAVLLAGLADSDNQLDAVGTLVILALCFAGGAWVPAFMLPKFLAASGPFLPTRWMLDGMAGATWRGLGLEHALRCAAVLVGWAALFTAIGVRRFRWG